MLNHFRTMLHWKVTNSIHTISASISTASVAVCNYWQYEGIAWRTATSDLTVHVT